MPLSKISLDILPCTIIETVASPAPVRGINKIGLQHTGFTVESIKAIHHTDKLFFHSSLLMEQIKAEMAIISSEKPFNNLSGGVLC